MANKKNPRSNLKPWVPGQSGNINGRPALSHEEKKLRKLTKIQFKEVGDMIVNGTMDGLDEILTNPSASVLQKQIAKALKVSYDKGDWHVVNILLDRLIGKVKEEVEVSTPKPTVVRMRNGEELIMGSKLENEDDDVV